MPSAVDIISFSISVVAASAIIIVAAVAFVFDDSEESEISGDWDSPIDSDDDAVVSVILVDCC